MFSSIKTLINRISIGYYIHRVWKFLVSAGCTIARVRKFLVSARCTIARVRKFLVFAGCTIVRVWKFPYMGKMSIFSMILEGEAYIVRCLPNGVDLTRFHDLVGSS